MATPHNDSMSTADSTNKSDQKNEDGGRVQIPTPLSSEENKEQNIQFVEV